MKNIEVTTPTVVDVLPLDEVKAHLRVTHQREDSLIVSMINAAIEVVEDDTGMALGEKAYKTWLDAFPSHAREFDLPRSPCTDARIQYIDEAGAWQEMVKDTDFFIDNSTSPSRLCLCPSVSWPATSERMAAVTILFRAGYTNYTLIPEKAKAILRILVTYFYEHRELLERLETGSAERVGEIYSQIKNSLKNWQFQ